MARLNLAITAEDNGASGILQGISKQVDELSKTTGEKFTAVGQSMQKAGGAMSLAVTAPLAAIGFKMLGMASDMSESMSKVNVLFGDQATQVTAWAETMAANFGQSKQEALDAAAGFAIFGKQAGLSSEEMLPFTERTAELASDLASFYNASPEQVIADIGAAMRGEAEPMRKYGVLLNADAIETQGLKMGLVDMNGEFDKSKQALAVQALIMEKTTVAHGDFTNTIGGLANQQRVVTAEIKNMGTEMGEQLLPIALEVVKAVKGLVDRFSNLSEGTQGWIVKIGLLLAAIGPILVVLGTLGTAIGGVITFLSAGGVAAGVLGTAFTVLTGPVGLVVAAVALLATAWTRDWGGIQEKTYAVVDAVKTKLTEWGSSLSNWWTENVSSLKAQAEESGGWFNLWKEKAGGAFEGVKDKVGEWGAGLTVWFDTVWAKMQEIDWRQFGEDVIYGIAHGILDAPNIIQDAINEAIGDSLTGMMERLGIHSPSTVTAKKIGLPMAQGIAVGIRSGMPEIMRSLTTNNYFDVNLAGSGSAGQDVFNSVQMLSALYG